MKKFDSVVAVFFLMISVFLFKSASDLPQISGLGDPGISFVPKILAILLFFLAVILFLQSIIKSRRGKETQNTGSNVVSKDLIKVFLLTIVSFMIYFKLLTLIGFLIITPLFMLFMIYIFRGRQIIKNLIVSILFTLILYFVFSGWLNVPLPENVLL